MLIYWLLGCLFIRTENADELAENTENRHEDADLLEFMMLILRFLECILMELGMLIYWN